MIKCYFCRQRNRISVLCNPFFNYKKQISNQEVWEDMAPNCKTSLPDWHSLAHIVLLQDYHQHSFVPSSLYHHHMSLSMMSNFPKLPNRDQLNKIRKKLSWYPQQITKVQRQNKKQNKTKHKRKKYGYTSFWIFNTDSVLCLFWEPFFLDLITLQTKLPSRQKLRQNIHFFEIMLRVTISKITFFTT